MLSLGERLPAKSAVIERDGQKYYVFQHILETCFPNVPQSTVRRWLRAIGKCLIRTNSLEREHIKKHGLKSRGFLISESTLHEVIHHAKTRRKYEKRHSQLSAESAPSSAVTDDLSEEPSSPKSSSPTDEHSMFEPASAPFSSSPVCVLTPREIQYPSFLFTDDLSEEPNCPKSCSPTDEHSMSEPTSAPFSSSPVCVPTSGEIQHTTPAIVSEEPSSPKSCSPTDEHSVPSNTSASSIRSPDCIPTSREIQHTAPAIVSEERSSAPKSCSPTDEHSIAPSTSSSIKIGCLKSEDTCRELRAELDELRNFYHLTVNPLRSCSAFSASTIKFLERVSCFLNYCRIKHAERKLDLSLVDDANIVQAYVTYQLEERKLNVSTVVRTLTALINLAKFVHRNSSDVDSCVELIRLKNVQRQLSQRQYSYQLAVKAGLANKETSTTFMFEHLGETIKSLRQKVDSFRGSPEHTRILHDFVLLSLYVTSMCGRSKEMRTLELFRESEDGKKFRFDWEKKCNVLVVSSDEGKFTLYENDFKNLRSHGPSKFEINDPEWLIPYLKEYIRKRDDLLCGKSHSFMFMTATGLAFTSSTFTSYLGNLFEREVRIRAGTTKLRHALVTHVLSLPESESLRLRESLAVLMRHSLKHQQVTYCDISRQDRTSLSRDLLNKSIEEASEIAESSTVATAVRSRRSKSVQRPCGEVSVGDIVALLDGVSTCAEDASVLVGRVMKIKGDDVLIMEFGKIEGSETLYRAVVDSSWWEKLDSVIYPIDIVYDSKKQAYELRSSAAEIYRVVFPEQ